MSHMASWLDQSSSQSRYSLHDLSHVDGDKTPVPFPPPPVTQSLYVPPRRLKLDKHSRATDDFVGLQRRERHLEQLLQELLDAQAERLVAGATDRSLGDATSDRSSTPTLSSSPLARSTYVRSNHHVPTLRAARRGISKSIQKLATVKAEEGVLLQTYLDDNNLVLDKINDWQSKQKNLQSKIHSIDHSESTSHIQNILAEAERLQGQISQLEEKLAELKAKHRGLLDQASASENVVEAEVSSYKASISMIDSQVREFLASPPAGAIHFSGKDSTFLNLPAGRRTLGMAKDYWQEERTLLEERYRQSKLHNEALEEGAMVWDTVMAEVTDFETSLRADLRSLNSDSKGKRRLSHEASPKGILDRMDRKIALLEEKLRLSEENNWNLLICCIGAELEAFKQGRELLGESLGVRREMDENPSVLLSTSSPRSSPARPPQSSASVSHKPKRTEAVRDLFDEQSDDPDPELLLSRPPDTDTD